MREWVYIHIVVERKSSNTKITYERERERDISTYAEKRLILPSLAQVFVLLFWVRRKLHVSLFSLSVF